jgi:hypothetical protein
MPRKNGYHIHILRLYLFYLNLICILCIDWNLGLYKYNIKGDKLYRLVKTNIFTLTKHVRIVIVKSVLTDTREWISNYWYPKVRWGAGKTASDICIITPFTRIVAGITNSIPNLVVCCSTFTCFLDHIKYSKIKGRTISAFMITFSRAM